MPLVLNIVVFLVLVAMANDLKNAYLKELDSLCKVDLAQRLFRCGHLRCDRTWPVWPPAPGPRRLVRLLEQHQPAYQPHSIQRLAAPGRERGGCGRERHGRTGWGDGALVVRELLAERIADGITKTGARGEVNEMRGWERKRGTHNLRGYKHGLKTSVEEGNLCGFHSWGWLLRRFWNLRLISILVEELRGLI